MSEESTFMYICKKMEYFYTNNNNYTDVLFKNYFFWQPIILFSFLLIIGFYNLYTNYEETIEYIKNNNLNFFLELLILFVVFFLTKIILYFTKGDIHLLNIKSLLHSSVYLLLFLLFKHISFELSGLYKLQYNTNTNNNNCNNKYSGSYWKNSGNATITILFILLLFFLFSIDNPNNTKKIFNYEFKKSVSLICIILIITIPFIVGLIMDNIPSTKIRECRDKKLKNSEILFEIFRNGSAYVSTVFLNILPLILTFTFIKLFSNKDFTKNNTSTTPVTKYSCNIQKIKKNQIIKLSIVLIESILIYLIFLLADIGIRSMRQKISYNEIIKDKDFFKKSIPIFIRILFIQVLLEYGLLLEKIFLNKFK